MQRTMGLVRPRAGGRRCFQCREGAAMTSSPSESRHTCHSHRSTPDTNLSHDHNHHTLFRRMRLRRGSLRIHRRTDHDASLSLSRLPAIQRRPVFVFRRRADGSFQALARLTTLPCLAQPDGWQDPSRAFALTAARRFRASPTRPLTLSRSEPRAWMIRAGLTRK